MGRVFLEEQGRAVRKGLSGRQLASLKMEIEKD